MSHFMQVRIPPELKKPIKIFAAEKDLTVPQAVVKLITTLEFVQVSDVKKKRT